MIDGGNLIGVDFLFVCFRHDHLLWLMEQLIFNTLFDFINFISIILLFQKLLLVFILDLYTHNVLKI